MFMVPLGDGDFIKWCEKSKFAVELLPYLADVEKEEKNYPSMSSWGPTPREKRFKRLLRIYAQSIQDNQLPVGAELLGKVLDHLYDQGSKPDKDGEDDHKLCMFMVVRAGEQRVLEAARKRGVAMSDLYQLHDELRRESTVDLWERHVSELVTFFYAYLQEWSFQRGRAEDARG